MTGGSYDDIKKSKAVGMRASSASVEATATATTDPISGCMTREETWRRMSSSVRGSTASASGVRGESSSSGQHPNHKPHAFEDIATVDAILFRPRLEALTACDDAVLSYDPSHFLTVTLSLRGRNFELIVRPLLALTAWGILWISVLTYVPGAERARTTIASMDGLISPLLVPVSFLLVFRLGRAAVRFWDARRAVGLVVETCRSSASTVAVFAASTARNGRGTTRWDDGTKVEGANHLVDDIDDGIRGVRGGGYRSTSTAPAEMYARWLCAFPIAVKNFLRSGRRGWAVESEGTKRRFEIGPLLSDIDAGRLLDVDRRGKDVGAGENAGPIFVLDRLRDLALRVSFPGDYPALIANDCGNGEGGGGGGDDARPTSTASAVRGAALYRRLNEHLDTLTGAWGAMERIDGTPLPLAYVAHLRTFLMLYLLLWYVWASAEYGWAGLPILILVGWGLLGIEAAAVECERPFRWDSNHLALGRMCVVVSSNVGQTLRDVLGAGEGSTSAPHSMPPFQPTG